MDPTQRGSLKKALAACALAAAAVLSLGMARTLSAEGPVVDAIETGAGARPGT